MKIFMTGATGYIGSAVSDKLLASGHQIAALARSDASADALKAKGIESLRADLSDTSALRNAAQAADGVIHNAFDQSGSDFAQSTRIDAEAVDALILGLKGSNKPLIYTSGTGVLGDTGDQVYEEDTLIAPSVFVVDALRVRLEIEKTVLNAEKVRGIVVRSPNVYGRGDGRALFWMVRSGAQKLGAVPYRIGAGDNKWTFVHVEDLADLFVLAIDKAPPGELFHAGAQSGLRTKDIATALSMGLGFSGKTIELDRDKLIEAIGSLPMADYWSSNSQSSKQKAQRLLGWNPKHFDLLTEVSQVSGRARIPDHL